MAALAIAFSANFTAFSAGEGLTPKKFDYFGPFEVKSPYMVDTLDVNSKKFDRNKILDNHVQISKLIPKTLAVSEYAPGDTNSLNLNILRFTIENRRFGKAKIEVEGLKNFNCFVDGEKTTGEVSLNPGTHDIVIKYLTGPRIENDSLKISVIGTPSDVFTQKFDGKRLFTIDDALKGLRVYNTSISPDGKYGIITTYTTRPGGNRIYNYRLVSLPEFRTIHQSTQPISWMPKSTKYVYERTGVNGTELIAADPSSGISEIIGENIPEGYYTISPDEKSLIYTIVEEGPKEGDVYQILNPEDRQPGWRNRTSIERYDLTTGLKQPLTFGNAGVSLYDISDDGSKLLVGFKRQRLEKRPTDLFTIAVLDINIMNVDTVVADDGFVADASFSPDASKILVSGSPEAFGGIGKNLPDGRIPSMYDYQLYSVDAATKKVTPLTRDFDPSISSFQWSPADNMIYIVANDRDMVNLFRIDPKNNKIEQIPTGEEVLNGITFARTSPQALYFGNGAVNPHRIHSLNTKNLKTTLLEEPRKEELSNMLIPESYPWSYMNSRGDSILGRVHLPIGFDPQKKYPMIVTYYGGCSPTVRNFESNYPPNIYASLGYVVYVVEPSGAAGFGQEFASRHVNTAGKGVADDIIEGVKTFCTEHPFVDEKKIGCIGASYGGFMTQYLQTVTDIFAAAVSHAGISDHTSYWGEGYWGYSYSEVSMAGSYPWSETELYVKQSPLYNADKIHTPLLFVHGDADTNVPFGESIQMFTALKLLGRDTALVGVTGQNHHILDYDKKLKWQASIFAWFAKYLQDDPSWWNELYPPKPL